MRHRPDPIVPVRDRRQHKRYLTLRNTGISVLALLVLFLSISLWSEVRPQNGGSYGNLFDRTLPKVEQKPIEVVEEVSPPAEETAQPTPMEIVDTDSATDTAPLWQLDDPQELSVVPSGVRQGGSKVTIVGGPEGVSIVRAERRKPVLSGGFGRELPH